MKNSFILLIAVVMLSSILTSCMGKNDVRISVDDSNGKLVLKVNANKKGKDIFYKKSFDAEGLNKAQKELIVKHILDSLGVNEKYNNQLQ